MYARSIEGCADKATDSPRDKIVEQLGLLGLNLSLSQRVDKMRIVGALLLPWASHFGLDGYNQNIHRSTKHVYRGPKLEGSG